MPVADWITRSAWWSGVSAMPLALNPGCCTQSPVNGSDLDLDVVGERAATGRAGRL